MYPRLYYNKAFRILQEYIVRYVGLCARLPRNPSADGPSQKKHTIAGMLLIICSGNLAIALPESKQSIPLQGTNGVACNATTVLLRY
jgi:hypothetical protein